ncbi:hypothetical protein BMG05_18275 [Mycobacterium malmoense]|nr:hypothetical protein BMG05_18275 [Mycobacterium malmoense]
MHVTHLVPCCSANDDRLDGQSWFKRWHDAYHQAAFRADITGRRYRVWYDGGLPLETRSSISPNN